MKKFFLLFFWLFLPLSSHSPKILVGSPVRQKPQILKEFLESLQRLKQEHYQLDFYFVDDNNLEESRELLKSFAKRERCRIDRGAPAASYVCNEKTHHWKDEQIWKVASYKNRMIDRARDLGYDYLFLIDSDIVLHPKTIDQLILDDKEIVSNIFWTKWNPDTPPLPQVWLYDTYSPFDGKPAKEETVQFIQQLEKPGLYEVGGLGACTLINKTALNKPISFNQIKNVSFWGEDRHFCIRAASLGIPLFVDTHHPAFHIYRESELAGVGPFKKNCEEKRGYRITLALVMRNEADRYLRPMLESAKQYITDAVIIDDASDDASVAVAEEILRDIPHRIIKNEQSRFSNEVVLRKQLWEETVKTDPDWILCLDADEIFEERMKEAIGTLAGSRTVDIYYFRLYDFWDSAHYRSDAFWSAHERFAPFLVRYKPNHKYVWKETPQHCGRFPLLSGQGKNSEIRLKHFGWANEQDRKAKYERYRKLDPEAKYGWKEQYESILDPEPHLIAWME